MAKSAIDSLAELKADFEKKSAAIKDKALEELREELKVAQSKVDLIQEQIDELTGRVSKKGAGAKRERLSKDELTGLVMDAFKFLPTASNKAITKGEIIEKMGINESSWQTVSKALKEQGLSKIGDKKSTKWYIKK